MLAHHRRMHEEHNSDSLMDGGSSSEHGENEDEALSHSVSIDLGFRPERSQTRPAMVEVLPVFNEEKHNSTTVLDLRTKLNALKDQERKLDQEVNAMIISFEVMEGYATGNAATSTLQDLKTRLNALKEQKYTTVQEIDAVTITLRVMEGCAKE